jgi:hypothetical protein
MDKLIVQWYLVFMGILIGAMYASSFKYSATVAIAGALLLLNGILLAYKPVYDVVTNL